MQRSPATLSERSFDLAIIGGGILGAGIARDAAMRGLSVALVDQADFGSGTSSASTKLVHGGLRYLQQYAFGLVSESCRERSVLLDTASHLVRPLPLLMPVYDGDEHSLFKLRLGTTLYDWMTWPRHPRLPRHTTLNAQEAMEREPALPAESPQGGRLRGAVVVYDCQMDDARLCLETVLDAARHGAACCNYAGVTQVRRDGDRVTGLQITDRLNSHEQELTAKCYVNAAGPWIQQLAEQQQLEPAIRLSPTKGAHVLIPEIAREHGLYFQSRGDGRMIFLVPWDGASLLGTTDTDFTADPGTATASQDDTTYLLDQLNSLLPDVNVSSSDVIAGFAGVRALIRSDSRKPSARSREEKIAQQADNMLSVAGGKYTTFRAIAEQVVDRVYRLLKKPVAPCFTGKVELPNERPAVAGNCLADQPDVYESDVAHACHFELAVTLDDVMRRRTRLALSRHGGTDVAEQVASMMAEHLNWNEDQREQQLQDYLQIRTASISG